MTEVRSVDRLAGPPATPSNKSPAHFLFVKIPFAICGVLLLTAVAINVANVIGRYVFDAPVSWAEEVMSYGIIWGVFIAVAAVTYQGNHLRMDLLVLSVRGLFAQASRSFGSTPPPGKPAWARAFLWFMRTRPCWSDLS
jgi:hypothetical protein